MNTAPNHWACAWLITAFFFEIHIPVVERPRNTFRIPERRRDRHYFPRRRPKVTVPRNHLRID